MKRNRKRIAKRSLTSIDDLLGYLCVEYGYCGATHLEFDILPTVKDFTDAVLSAEGIDPLGYCEHKQLIREIVADCYEDMGGRVELGIYFPTT